MAQLLEEPQALDLIQLNVNDTGLDQAVRQQRLRLLRLGAVNDAVVLGVDRRPHGFGKIRVLRDHQ